jgi:hypothetical protein
MAQNGIGTDHLTSESDLSHCLTSDLDEPGLLVGLAKLSAVKMRLEEKPQREVMEKQPPIGARCWNGVESLLCPRALIADRRPFKFFLNDRYGQDLNRKRSPDRTIGNSETGNRSYCNSVVNTRVNERD